ncbi:RNA cytidine acetyltransferase [Armadillidium vulgare]|nr:RNA cytidine acetyltransferase [Armadillidium vulgare]
MVKRRVDNRVRILIENGIASGHRSLFIVVGERCQEQVIYLHHILSKASLKQADVLWCYKSKLHYSSNRRKRMKQLKAKQKFGNASVNEDDPFEMFVSMTNIIYRYYKDTHKILGNTFKMCVLQDFETMTPNILCRTVETVEGGGVIVILLESMTSLKQLYTLNMDVHSRYRTEAHQVIVPRFNERFILSLASCKSCLVVNDELQIIPISSSMDIEPLPFSYSDAVLAEKNEKLREMQESVKDIKPLGTLLALCKTLDQGIVVKQFISAITENSLSSTITLTAARGRGKSAAMGLSLAGALYVGYANVFVTSPSPENLKTFFEFLLKGLDSLGYEKHINYEVLVSSDPEHNKSILNVTVKKEYKQFVQYISPYESDVLDNAELVIIDEAAAIPLPQVQALLGPYLVFLASTISGYEGTGRSLSLKLIKELREQAKEGESDSMKSQISDEKGLKKRKIQCASVKRKLIELGLEESIRYKGGDPIEKWLFDLLCLESSLSPLKKSLPNPEECSLFYVNRDVLFCYHKMTEKFLKNVMNLLVASHYKNTPDDLQMLSDAPAHQLFVLLPPTGEDECPQPICVVFEGKISKVSLESLGNSSQRKPAGDMIPWTINSYYDDDEFPQLSGARVVRIATHPDMQGRGFGTRAMKLLEEYYCRSASKASTEEVVIPKSDFAFHCVEDEEISKLKSKSGELSEPLLISVDEREPEALHYLGVSFGSSFPLVNQVKNIQTGEYSSLFIKKLKEDKLSRDVSWLKDIWFEFKDIMTLLLQGPFRQMETKFALSFLTNKIYKRKQMDPSVRQLKTVISDANVKYLNDFLNHSKDFHQVANLFSRLSVLYFTDKIPIHSFKTLRQAILVGVGVQMKHPSVVAEELQVDLPILMSEIYSIISEIYNYFSKKYSDSEGS